MTQQTFAHVEAAGTLAVIASSTAPLVLLDAELTVIAASLTFCQAFGLAPDAIHDCPLAGLGGGEWSVPQLMLLLKATVAGAADVDAYELDLIRPGQPVRRLVINAHKLDYGDEDHVRVLLAVTDVTDARAMEQSKDELLRRNAVLLREVQHRVANSLQIIASILMQSARRVQSDEARTQLHNAHHRVLSIATVQRHLMATRIDDVALRPYLAQLCESLAASMIQDPAQLAIKVTVDDSTVDANVSVSLGLIVTELVINALKHAFPDSRAGRIAVGYRAEGAGWVLTVEDDGVGMPDDAADAKPGLGTGIVEALARQLQATATVSDGKPGTHVRIACEGPAAEEAPVAAI